MKEKDHWMKEKDHWGLFSVTFHYGTTYVYPTLLHANIGRMWAAALKNVPKTNKRSKNGWADLARATGIINPRANTRRSFGGPSYGIAYNAYNHAVRGTLPKDPEKVKKLIELAGPPWTEDPELIKGE